MFSAKIELRDSSLSLIWTGSDFVQPKQRSYYVSNPSKGSTAYLFTHVRFYYFWRVSAEFQICYLKPQPFGFFLGMHFFSGTLWSKSSGSRLPSIFQSLAPWLSAPSSQEQGSILSVRACWHQSTFKMPKRIPQGGLRLIYRLFPCCI